MLELVVVIGILAALAALVTPMVGDHSRQAAATTTRESFRRLQEVILNRYWPDMNNVLLGRDGLPQPSAGDLGLSNNRVDHPQLQFLFVKPASAPIYDPITRRGWNGPYLQNEAAFPNPASPEYAGRNFSENFGEPGDPNLPPTDPLRRPDHTVLDGWGRPIVLVRVVDVSDPYLFARLVSAGNDGILATSDDLSLDLRKAP